MTTNQSQRVGFGTERSLASTSFNGDYQVIGTPLDQSPTVIIFDNSSDVSVPLSIDGVNTWRTFPAGEAVLLDLRANHGNAPNYSIDNGTQFYTNAAVGTSGSISISFIYGK